MSVEDYQRNLRGVNDGSDFSPEFVVRETSVCLVESRLIRYVSKTSMTPFESEKSFYLKNIEARPALNTHGRNSSRVHGKQAIS